MTDGYDCHQNVLAERINGILQQEFLLGKCNTFEELEKVIDQLVELYNGLRSHLSLSMQAPHEEHKKAGYQR